MEAEHWYIKNKEKFTYSKEGYTPIDFNYIINLVRFLKHNNIDVIHAHELKAAINALLAGHKRVEIHDKLRAMFYVKPNAKLRAISLLKPCSYMQIS